MTRWWCLGVICVLALTSMLAARQGVVKTKEGQTFAGDITDDPDSDSVSIVIHGVITTVVRSSIASISYSGNFEQEFQQRLGKLAAGDLQGHIDLARWALDNKQYELARQAITMAQTIDSKNGEANSLADTIRSEQALAVKRANPAPPAAAEPAAPPAAAAPASPEATAVAAPGPTSRRFLSDDDINLIRQAELQPADAAIQVRFLNHVTERYLASGGKDAAVFRSMPPGQQAMEMLATGDAGIAKDVRIVSDPVSLVTYRTRIQPLILAGCASSGCHGGADGGDFYLYPDAGQVPAAYTNFYILNKYAHKVSGGGGQVMRSMIDRTQPDSSLLIQFGLPTNMAQTPHPKAKGWKPLYPTEQDPTRALLVNWTGQQLKPFVSDYGIKFELPTGKSSTQPSGE